jgi:AcrR family transcriptional regulator
MSSKQRIEPRKPQQERARHKVELILEASIRVLEKNGTRALTTNAVAETAGVSIGTLYQYFTNKEAILDALADREIALIDARLRSAMTDSAVTSPEERVAAILAAFVASFAERLGAHRLILGHALSRGGIHATTLLSDLISYLSFERQVGAIRMPLAEADAFVVIHSFAGVMRAMVMETDAPPRDELERSLTYLLICFTERSADVLP